MEQMNLFSNEITTWVDRINKVMDCLSQNEELPTGSLRLVENKSRNQLEITSYSVALTKPDYPRGVNINGKSTISLFNIQEKKKSVNKKQVKTEELVFCLPDALSDEISHLFPDVEIKKRKSEPNFSRMTIRTDNDQFDEISNHIIKKAVDRYFSVTGANAFGCCHLFVECSDAKKCLHENKLYARGCIYFHNLKDNRIFYGKNKNI